MSTTGRLSMRGAVVDNPDSTTHLLEEHPLIAPYLCNTALPVVSLDHPTDLKKAVLVHNSTFADVIRWRDNHLLTNSKPNELSKEFIRIPRSGPKVIFKFWLVPLRIDGVFWTWLIAADSKTLDKLRTLYPVNNDPDDVPDLKRTYK